jgi:hypothetical protein
MGEEAGMGSTMEIGETYKGSEDAESEDSVELLEEVKLEVSGEVQINKGTGRCILDVMALSLSSDDSSYSYLQTLTLKVWGQQIEKKVPLRMGWSRGYQG